MAKETKHFKALNFDLVIAELKQHYPNGHHTKAYKDIKAFMKRNSFEHRQGSGYLSEKPLTNIEVYNVVDVLYTQFPWFVHCVNKFDVTNVGEAHDLAAMFANIKAAERTADPLAREDKAQKPSILAQLKKNAEAVKAVPEDGREKAHRSRANKKELEL